MAQGPPRYSADGRWMWDGRQWVSVPAPPGVGPRSTSSRNLLLAGGLVGLVLVLGVCGLGVCALAVSLGGASSTGPAPAGDVSGTYALKQIDGHDLPAGGSFNQLVIDGSLQLKPDGSYSIRFSWQGELGTGRYTGDDGLYTRSGSTLAFQPKEETYRYTGQLGDRSVLVTYDWSRNGKVDRFLFRR
jgi:hypothetical protein